MKLKFCYKHNNGEGAWLPIENFYFYHFKGKPNGYYVSPCKECKNKKRAEYREVNREKVRKQSYISTKKYRDKNRPRLRKEERIHKAEKKLKEELENWCIVLQKKIIRLQKTFRTLPLDTLPASHAVGYVG